MSFALSIHALQNISMMTVFSFLSDFKAMRKNTWGVFIRRLFVFKTPLCCDEVFFLLPF